MAEETGLIVPLGEWVLRQTCNQVTSWLESGRTAVPVAVNLSSVQFHGADLLTLIATILTETALDPTYLAVEITESMIMHDIAKAREVLHALSDFGVQVAIDDFGTGHSTLSLTQGPSGPLIEKSTGRLSQTSPTTRRTPRSRRPSSQWVTG